MSARFDPAARGFHLLSEAWYGKAFLFGHAEIGVIDCIMLGYYPQGGGTSGEIRMEYIKLSGRMTWRMQVFSDAWPALGHMSDLLPALNDFVGTPTVAEVVASLRRLGFRDLTVRVEPC